MVKGPAPQEQANFLGGCLVESDFEFEKRARKIKRRALVASIVLQILVVAALVLFPLLSKGESIAAYNPTIIPPYRHGAASPQHPTGPRPTGSRQIVCVTCVHNIRPIITDRGPVPAADPFEGVDNTPPGSPEGEGIPGLPDGFASRRDPLPPQPIERAKPRTVQVSAGVQAARLVHRVEPIYPILAKQARREGRVELRARISTEGRVVSLEVVTGDPLLIRSSLDAVREWRYQPTLLNNEPVEVETYITVIYTLNR